MNRKRPGVDRSEAISFMSGEKRPKKEATTSVRRLTVAASATLFWYPTASHAASSYYVDATNGNDNTNDGESQRPWKTIGKASAVMQAGDTCVIRTGTYRETMRPMSSGASGAPITYRADVGATVILSGADVISGFSLDSGDIYRAPMGWDLGARKNQVFVDGRMMVEARWPNLPWDPDKGFDLLEGPFANATSMAGSTTVSIPTATQAEGFWTNATIWAEIGDRWTSQNATVTASSPGGVTISGKSNPWFPDSDAIFGDQGFVYLTGVRAALDSPGEWFSDGGTLYLMTVDRSNPTSHLVEARTNRLLVDLSMKSFIVLQGINGYAGTMDVTGTDCTIEGGTFRYVTHDFGEGYATRGGIKVGGSNNLIQRCVVDTSSGNGIDLGGTHNTLRDCTVQNVNYHGDYSAGVNFSGDSNVLEHSTISHAGRALVGPNGTKQTIRYNDFSRALRLTQDGGAFYSWGVDSQGTVIAYNWVHDILPSPGAPAPYTGVYLDDGCHNYVVHHNVIWNCKEGMRLGHIHPASGHRVYNNTMWQNPTVMAQHGSDTFTDVLTWNNLADADQFVGTDLQRNLATKSPRFVDQATNDFRLQTGSPAIDYGNVIQGITDGYQGAAPDVGAYESGGDSWTAGARFGPMSTTADAGVEGGIDDAGVSATDATSSADGLASLDSSTATTVDAGGVPSQAAAASAQDTGKTSGCSCSVGRSAKAAGSDAWLALGCVGISGALRRRRRHYGD
jgi:hypothetical protein